MKRVIFLIASIISPLFANGGFGYWLGGLGYGEVLGVSGYPSPKNYGLMVGGEGYGIWNKFILGGGGYGIRVFPSRDRGFSVSPIIWSGYFSLGYALVKSDRVLLFPSAHLGGGGYDLRISEIKSGSYNDLIQNPPRYISVSSTGFYAGISLNFLYRAPLIFGLNTGVGYVFSPAYYINENNVSDTPLYRKPSIWLNILTGRGYWK